MHLHPVGRILEKVSRPDRQSWMLRRHCPPPPTMESFGTAGVPCQRTAIFAHLYRNDVRGRPGDGDDTPMYVYGSICGAMRWASGRSGTHISRWKYESQPRWLFKHDEKMQLLKPLGPLELRDTTLLYGAVLPAIHVNKGRAKGMLHLF